MNYKIDYHTPLGNYFEIPAKYMECDISTFTLYAQDIDYKPSTKRIVNALASNQLNTYKAVLGKTWHNISEIRGLGINSQLLLFELLCRVESDPERLKIELEAVVPDKAKQLAKRYLDRQQLSFEEVLKQVRINEIKRKLRAMGVIN